MNMKARGGKQKIGARGAKLLRFIAAFACLLLLFFPASYGADISAPAAVAISEQARFDQNLGATVPLDTVFRDEQGQPTTFRSLLGQRPVVLVMGYHECPMLCSLVLTGVVEALTEIRPTTGKDFDLVDLSISPADSPETAAKQKRIYFKRYLRAGADGGWHFLTSPDAAAIKTLTDAVGFHYAYDPATKQYAHPSGLVILTPEGKISRYMFGVNFDADQLQTALANAGKKQVSSPIAQLLLVCFHYNPVTGKYGALIMNSLRVAGVLTILALAGGIAYLVRRPLPLSQA